MFRSLSSLPSFSLNPIHTVREIDVGNRGMSTFWKIPADGT